METGYLQSHPLIALLSILAMLFASSWVLLAPRLHRSFMRSYTTRTLIFFVATRLGFLLLLHVAIGYLPGPDRSIWHLHGTSALNGLLPYIDYPSEYGPFFSYLLAPAFLLFGSTLGPVIVFIVFDFLAFTMLRYATEDSGLNQRAATLYLIIPLSWFMVVRGCQDESIGAFLLLLIFILDRLHKRRLLPVILGLGAAATKILLMLPAFPILAGNRRGLARWMIAWGIIVLCYIPFHLMGGDLFLWKPGPERCGGVHIWAALELPAVVYCQFATMVAGLVISALAAIVVWRKHILGSVNSILMLYAALMLTSPKAWPPYALLVLPFICLKIMSLGKRRDLILLSLYNFMLLLYLQIGPPIWWEGRPVMWLVSKCCTLSIVGYHFYLLWISTADIRRSPT